VRPINSVYATVDAPNAAKLKSRFALDCFKRNQINRLIIPIVKHAAAAADQRIVTKLKNLPKNVNSYYQKVRNFSEERNKKWV
jgi:hypothetical protein